MWDEAGRLTEWLGEVPIEAQLLKMSEEVGEAAEAYLEYASRLRDKLGEEVAEFLASDGDPMELADIMEVVYALAAAGGTGPAELDALRAAKAASNGAFAQRLVWHGNRDDGDAAAPP